MDFAAIRVGTGTASDAFPHSLYPSARVGAVALRAGGSVAQRLLCRLAGRRPHCYFENA